MKISFLWHMNLFNFFNIWENIDASVYIDTEIRCMIKYIDLHLLNKNNPTLIRRESLDKPSFISEILIRAACLLKTAWTDREVLKQILQIST